MNLTQKTCVNVYSLIMALQDQNMQEYNRECSSQLYLNSFCFITIKVNGDHEPF